MNVVSGAPAAQQQASMLQMLAVGRELMTPRGPGRIAMVREIDGMMYAAIELEVGSTSVPAEQAAQWIASPPAQKPLPTICLHSQFCANEEDTVAAMFAQTKRQRR